MSSREFRACSFLLRNKAVGIWNRQPIRQGPLQHWWPTYALTDSRSSGWFLSHRPEASSPSPQFPVQTLQPAITVPGLQCQDVCLLQGQLSSYSALYIHAHWMWGQFSPSLIICWSTYAPEGHRAEIHCCFSLLGRGRLSHHIMQYRKQAPIQGLASGFPIFPLSPPWLPITLFWGRKEQALSFLDASSLYFANNFIFLQAATPPVQNISFLLMQWPLAGCFISGFGPYILLLEQ